jgi:hypothetical protein
MAFPYLSCRYVCGNAGWKVHANVLRVIWELPSNPLKMKAVKYLVYPLDGVRLGQDNTGPHSGEV